MLLSLCGMIWAIQSQAQEKCATQTLLQNIIDKHPENTALRNHYRAHSKNQAEVFAKTAKFKTTAQVKIPVVFHVILTQSEITQLGGTGTILQRAIDQINVLNEDFNKANNDRIKAPSAFAPLQGSLDISFGLAHRTPTGGSTSGVEIKTTTLAGFSAFADNGNTPKYVSSGGLDAWDPNQYLNIWIVNITGSGGILGYCVPPSFLSFPQQYTISDLGVVIDYGAFGRRATTINFFSPSTNDRGRTATHEVAHYFELEHTFGNNASCPGNGDVDDLIADTPPQADNVFGSPTFPRTDACSPIFPGVMFMNFMDYTDDTAMYMFTQGQANFVQSKLTTGILKSITEHPDILDWPTSVLDIDLEHQLNIFPNPSTGKFTLGLSKASDLKQVIVLNAVGQTVYALQPHNSTITNYDLDLSGMSRGVYMVQCTFGTGIVTRKIVLQ